MAITGDLKNQYAGVLNDLEGERAGVQHELGSLQKKLRELDNAIMTLRRRVDPSYTPTAHTGSVVELRSSTAPAPTYPPDQKYAFIGVRWAILHLLNESEPMTTSDIAEKLRAAGVRTRAKNFTNNVSAVLTDTMRSRDQEEVEQVNGKWQLTELGRNKIAHIITTPDFLRSCPWAGVPDISASSAAN